MRVNVSGKRSYRFVIDIVPHLHMHSSSTVQDSAMWWNNAKIYNKFISSAKTVIVAHLVNALTIQPLQACAMVQIHNKQCWTGCTHALHGVSTNQLLGDCEQSRSNLQNIPCRRIIVQNRLQHQCRRHIHISRLMTMTNNVHSTELRTVKPSFDVSGFI